MFDFKNAAVFKEMKSLSPLPLHTRPATHGLDTNSVNARQYTFTLRALAVAQASTRQDASRLYELITW